MTASSVQSGQAAAGAPTPPDPPSGFRPDVEGLRAVAVGPVLVFHAGLPFVKGGYVGVDVFFVISGFLITGLLVREIEQTGSLSLRGFWSRRARRLLPLTVVVLTAVALASWWLFSPVRRLQLVDDVVASGLYVINWRLAASAVDYFGPSEPSPLQHFWSLAVEEQFYLAWPVLLLAVTWWARRGGRSLRPRLLGAVLAVGAASFAYNLYATYVSTEDAYFSTFTRGWELALGAALALVLPRVRAVDGPPARLAAAALGWGGMAAIAWAVLSIDGRTRFPGTAALWPTLGAAAVIAAGALTPSGGAARLLTLPVMRHVGRVSYAWYLWHWPLLVLAAAAWGRLSVLQGVTVAAASYLPAVLTHHLVEQPFRRSTTLAAPARGLAVGAACMALALAVAGLLQVATPRLPVAAAKDVDGAEAVRDGATTPQATAQAVRPEPAAADLDRGRMFEDGCLVRPPDTESGDCVYGDPASATTVVLFGDSHMMQYFPALEQVAQDRGWRLVGLTKSGCPPAEVELYNRNLGRSYTECDDWRAATLDRIVERERPTLVVTSGLEDYPVLQDGATVHGRAQRDQLLAEGYAATLQRLRETGAEVVVVRDSPRRLDDPAGCVSESLDDLDACSAAASKVLRTPSVNAAAALEVDGVTLLDPTPLMCPEGECPAVIGNALVYRNEGHLTATYARTLAPWFDEHLAPLVRQPVLDDPEDETDQSVP